MHKMLEYNVIKNVHAMLTVDHDVFDRKID